MGRKKSNRPVRTRPLPSIPRIFDCPRCEATAIRISVETDVALVECGNCLLKQTITNIKAIEESVDIYGSFVDEYYNNIELHEVREESVNTETNFITTEDESVIEEGDMDSIEEENQAISEEKEEEPEEEEPATFGFVPRSKGEVLKKKQKQDKNKKIIL